MRVEYLQNLEMLLCYTEKQRKVHTSNEFVLLYTLPYCFHKIFGKSFGRLYKTRKFRCPLHVFRGVEKSVHRQ